MDAQNYYIMLMYILMYIIYKFDFDVIIQFEILYYIEKTYFIFIVEK